MVPCTLNHTYIHANYKNKNWCHNRSKHKHYGYIYIYIEREREREREREIRIEKRKERKGPTSVLHVSLLVTEKELKIEDFWSSVTSLARTANNTTGKPSSIHQLLNQKV